MIFKHPNNMIIKEAQYIDEIKNCFPVIKELRAHLSEEEFIEKVKLQCTSSGYKLIYLEVDNKIVCCAGYRISACLAWGKFLYVDDFVTLAAERGKGYGEKLFEWLLQEATDNKCSQLHLDSGVQRFDAHKFYLSKNMKISSHHFSIEL